MTPQRGAPALCSIKRFDNGGAPMNMAASAAANNRNNMFGALASA